MMRGQPPPPIFFPRTATGKMSVYHQCIIAENAVYNNTKFLKEVTKDVSDVVSNVSAVSSRYR